MTAAIDNSAVEEQRLSETFAALANETRRKLLHRLASGEASVNELAEPFDMSLPAISKHLKVLESAGLVTRSQRAQYRPCKLNPEPLTEAASWAQNCRETWEASFDRLDSFLQQIQAASSPTNSPTSSAKNSKKNRASNRAKREPNE